MQTVTDRLLTRCLSAPVGCWAPSAIDGFSGRRRRRRAARGRRDAGAQHGGALVAAVARLVCVIAPVSDYSADARSALSAGWGLPA